MEKRQKLVDEMTTNERKEHYKKNRGSSFRPGCIFESDKYKKDKIKKQALDEAWSESRGNTDEES